MTASFQESKRKFTTRKTLGKVSGKELRRIEDITGKQDQQEDGRRVGNSHFFKKMCMKKKKAF